jgi:hypothetical protein
MRSFALLLGTLELQHLVRRGDDKVVASAVVNPQMPKRFRQPRMPKGGLHQPPPYISSSTIARNKIPKATPAFSGSSYSMVLVPTMCDVILYRKQDGGPPKPEVPISQLWSDIET